jgi:tRNA A-37 threonylcarbamoyl transferase component Bud32
MAAFIDWAAGSVRWQLRADLCAGLPDSLSCPLLGPDGLRLADWLAWGQARLVKKGLHRTVYRVVLPSLDFHLKFYPLTDTRAWLRQLVRPSKARMEYEKTQAVASRGVPTLEPLAIGECGEGPQASYLITRTLPDTVPLSTYLESTLPNLPPRLQAHMRQRLAVTLGQFLAAMHDAGIIHDDLHPGNILVQLPREDVAQFYLIDLDAVRLGSSLDWPASRENLVILNRWFILRASRSDRLRCWKAYRQARRQDLRQGRAGGCFGRLLTRIRETATPRAEQPDHYGNAARDLEQRTVTSNLRFWRSHDKRCLGNNRYFQRVRSPLVVGHAVADLDRSFLDALLADPDAPFGRPDAILLKEGRSSTVIEMDAPGPNGPRRVIYKRFNLTTWTDLWAALVRQTPALRSYAMGHALRWRGLPTPRPLAVWHRRRHGLRGEGYLLTEKLPEARHLLDFVTELEQLDPARRRTTLRSMIDQAGRLIATLHQRQMSHRDLKAANLLVSSQPWRVQHPDRLEPDHDKVQPVPAERSQQLWFIDLDGVARQNPLQRTRRVQDLVRLHASFHAHPGITRTDKLRFLRVYLRWGLRGQFGWKRWWRQIEQGTLQKILRNLRNGRPLG